MLHCKVVVSHQIDLTGCPRWGRVHKCVYDQMLPRFPQKHEARQCPIGSGRQQSAPPAKRRNRHHKRISGLNSQSLGSQPSWRLELELRKIMHRAYYFYQKANTYDTRVFVIHLLRDDCLLCFHDDRQHKWHSLIATIGTYTNIDLVGEVIAVIRLSFYKWM
jgi:hypothetical protein